MLLTDRLRELSTQNPYFTVTENFFKPLPYPVYFVTKDPKWLPLINNPDLAFDDSFYELCVTGHDMWSAQAYLDLKRRGFDVHLVSEPVPGKICIIPYYYLQPKDWLFKSYVIGCRYDTPHPQLCNHRIVINPLQVRDQTHHYLPHRPQPNLRPRDALRGITLKNLVFKGHSYNLAEPFRTPEFLSALEAMGITLRMSTENLDSSFADWANYTEADAVIAVRNNTVYDISLKPALKLINAWFAGCPAILGPEPGYQQIRRSELDYFEVRTPEEAIAALQRLQQDPELYLAMVENGFKRAQEYTLDRVILEWHHFLTGPIAQGYEQWLRRSAIEKQFGRPLRYAGQIVRQKLAEKEYKHKIHHGPRILEGAQSSV
ncbi:glycosyltransferase [Leptolyngbya sp. ST-U4]|uniref:glycosyltransferase n=1 Tax=Leptolyngbya sp. ST-U4 TaxID=2933912 RepID=UPI0019C2563F|nr:glycosyltransferase family 1 protein [Cyanobacteria bacterium FACHB-502]